MANPAGGDHDGNMRRLLPSPATDISVDDAYSSPLGTNGDRPWISLCMVASIDGSTVVDGRSAELSSPTDSAVLQQLRRLADVIVVGAGTVRDEGYGRPRTPHQRVGVVTRSGELDFDSELFSSGAGFVITFAGADVRIPEHIDVICAGDGSVDLDRAIRRLDDVSTDCRVVQVEGGPALNAAMLEADLLDEINVTTSPATVGGSGPRLAAGAAPLLHRYDLAQLAIDDQSFVFTRWLRRRGS